MASISGAHEWAVVECEKDNVGYSQTYRNQQTVDGITYYDCSSFIWYALKAGGFDVEAAHGSTYPFVTQNMGAALLSLGFTRYTDITIPWYPGDILLLPDDAGSTLAHTMMCYQGRRLMGARNSHLSLAEQVSIEPYDTDPNNTIYTELWRAPQSTYSWIVKTIADDGTQYLTQSEMENNANCVYGYIFNTIGFVDIRNIAAILGCWEIESNINPGTIEQGVSNPLMGIGLAQWTNSRHTDLINWCTQQGYSTWQNGDAQMSFFLHELDTYNFRVTTQAAMRLCPAQYRYSDGMQWVRDSNADFTLEARLAWFLNAFEMGGGSYSDEYWNRWWSTRWPAAQRWYEYLTNVPPPGPSPVSHYHKMPLWMMLKPWWKI